VWGRSVVFEASSGSSRDWDRCVVEDVGGDWFLLCDRVLRSARLIEVEEDEEVVC